jgi:hypothetical protein
MSTSEHDNLMTALRIVAHADHGIIEPGGRGFRAALTTLVMRGWLRCDRTWRITEQGTATLAEENRRLGLGPEADADKAVRQLAAMVEELRAAKEAEHG